MAASGSPTPSSPLRGDQNRGWALIAFNATFSGIVLLLLLARLYTRTLIGRNNVGLDDYCIIMAVVSNMFRSNMNTQ